MARRSGLGRGLGSLIPTEVAAPQGTKSPLREIPLAQIRPNPLQPRLHFEEEALSFLASSIKELGVLQPILVRGVADDEFELIAGERRWRAARRAGLQVIPALVQPANDITSLKQALVENLHREDLNPLEEAAAYQQLIEDFGLTHEEVAAQVGRSRAGVSNILRLLQLPAGIQRAVVEGHLTAGHARALLGTPDRNLQEVLARKAMAEGWTVRAVEEAVRAAVGGTGEAAEADDGGSGRPGPDGEVAGAPPAVASPAGMLRPPGLLELEELLADLLNTRVRVEMGSKRGRVVVEFATLEDLERIYRVMAQGSA